MIICAILVCVTMELMGAYELANPPVAISFYNENEQLEDDKKKLEDDKKKLEDEKKLVEAMKLEARRQEEERQLQEAKRREYENQEQSWRREEQKLNDERQRLLKKYESLETQMLGREKGSRSHLPQRTKTAQEGTDSGATESQQANPGETVSGPVVALSIGVLVFGLVVLLLQWSLLRRMSSLDPQSILRLFSITLIITGALFLIVAGYSTEQIAPAIGLLGTIAGYLVGSTSKTEDKPTLTPTSQEKPEDKQAEGTDQGKKGDVTGDKPVVEVQGT